MDQAIRFERAADKIRALAGRGLNTVDFWRACTPVLAETVPHFQTPCCYTLDPASRLITSHFQEDLVELPADWATWEYAEPGPNQIIDIALTATGVSTLHDATAGDPSGSPRWQANISQGGDQEMIAALRSSTGELWGAIGLYREPEQPLFNENEKAFVATISPHLARGVRRSLLFGEAADPDNDDAPGMVVLDHELELVSVSPGVNNWLAALTDPRPGSAQLPSALLAVAARALRSSPDDGEVAVSRVLTRSGRWLLLHGLILDSAAERRVAVIIEPADPARIAPLLMSAYDLTEREQELTRLVLQGRSTADIAAELVISVHTVQQHLKSVFDKTGVHSRRELVTKVFLAHYEPRMRDNERRTQQNRPIRGGPVGAPWSM